MNIYDFYITPEEYARGEKNGIRPALLEIRIRTLCWDKERAINTPPHTKKSLDEWVKVAEANGICYSTLRYRANRLGWNLERAATQPLQDRKMQAKQACDKSRKYPKEYVDLAKKNGINYDTFRHRMKHGWNIEVAATKATMTSREIGLFTKEKRQKGLCLMFPHNK